MNTVHAVHMGVHVQEHMREASLADYSFYCVLWQRRTS